MNENTAAVWIVLMLLALVLTFCGDPDLHDAALIHLMQDNCLKPEGSNPP